MTELTGKVGFASPISEKVSSRKGTLGVELIATLALAICLIIAATAVSIGMARAQSLVNGKHEPLGACLFGRLAADDARKQTFIRSP